VLKPLAKFNVEIHADEFRKTLVSWFKKNGKDYPWRQRHDAYGILVSEVMLQQTRLNVVLEKGYYVRFMEKFPNVKVLAESSEEELLRTWEGLGYYRRARMLQATARAVIENFKGEFPKDLHALQKLPGIGRYTAGAMMSFSFNVAAPIVDGNIFRVFARLFNDNSPIDSSACIRNTWLRAEKLLDEKHPRFYNAALMELGQQICKVGIPDCLNCPVAIFCQSNEPEKLPVKEKLLKITEFDEHVVFVKNEAGEILLKQEQGSRRNGFWKLPTRKKEQLLGMKLLDQSKYTITRYRVSLFTYGSSEKQLEEHEVWVNVDRLNELPISAPYRKVLNRLLG
jgi:A/G-specific adenine glycosylase